MVTLGHTYLHAGNVEPVPKLQIGHCSSQFHVVIGNRFTTVPYLNGSVVNPNQENLVTNALKHIPKDDYYFCLMITQSILGENNMVYHKGDQITN